MKIFISIMLSVNLFSQVVEKQNKLLWDGTDWNNIEKRANGGPTSIYQIKSAYISGLLDGRLYYYLKAWAKNKNFADTLYSDRLDYLTNKETIRQLDRFYSDILMTYVPVISAIIIVHMEAEQVSKKTIDLYIDQTKYWINELTINMEEEGMHNLLKNKQKKYTSNKK
tara:strand:+ start:381 stop:884 length:504 start_codon:yes stop_codon:yes gene_type:complete